mgnify:CR=1 FL=1
MNEKKKTQNSFFRAFLKSSLESVGSNAKMKESDELIKWFQSATHIETSVDLYLKDDDSDISMYEYLENNCLNKTFIIFDLLESQWVIIGLFIK